MSELFAGVMSGTSVDGADVVVADFSAGMPRTLAFSSVSFDERLRADVLSLSRPGTDGLDLAGRVSLELARVYARAVDEAIAKAGVDRRAIRAIGCHGQTVRHRPDQGFTVQLNDPALLAELTGIDVAADFRRRDMAAGGQGAPLVPAFHEAVFRHGSIARAVVNIGGIGNVTWLAPGRPVAGFDCGPGNVLMDAWARRHRGALFDEDGKWAASGRVDRALLERLLGEAYLHRAPPKSTGRELFRLEWLQERLLPGLAPADVQSTLAEFTARAIVDAIDRFCVPTGEIYLAGGGARNPDLVSRIAGLAGKRAVALTDALGVPTGHVEALAFAWLAMKCVHRDPVDLASSTGARGPRILGAIYPA
ncbi:MAG TPA: anhydro-N-acetylmuramic acid kinase [Usitatibacter sp.]|nr:anhydro-N-acetylmuramic acid kinase [Usitatibacter sp.]